MSKKDLDGSPSLLAALNSAREWGRQESDECYGTTPSGPTELKSSRNSGSLKESSGNSKTLVSHTSNENQGVDVEAVKEWLREKAALDASKKKAPSSKDTNLPLYLASESPKESQVLDKLYSLYNEGKAEEWQRGFKTLLEAEFG